MIRKLIALAVILALIAGSIYVWTLKHQIDLLTHQLDKNLTDRATELGVTTAQIHRATALISKLNSENARILKELEKVRPGVKPVEILDGSAQIVPQIVPQGPGSPPGTWSDQHHRFKFDLGSQTMARSQEFHLQTVVIQSPGGTRLAHQTLEELDPVTHEVITDEPPIKTSTSFSVVKEEPVAPPIFHLRAVGGVGYLGQVGAGVEVLNLERVGGVWRHATVSVLALYNHSDRRAEGSVVLGFRPFNWNISVGPAYFFPTNSLGAAATIELTR